MRAAARLFASVKPGQFLEAGTPTGLTGLLTHPSPRSTLLYHYTSTLDKLKQIPESSVYRQSTEALTKHRLDIVNQSKPAGWDQWQEKIKMQLKEDPGLVSVIEHSKGQTLVLPKIQDVDVRSKLAEWDGEAVQSFPEGIRSAKERLPHVKKLKGDVNYSPDRAFSQVKFDPEPQYTTDAYVTNSGAELHHDTDMYTGFPTLKADLALALSRRLSRSLRASTAWLTP
jgi:NADH dehydrogenase (ubiquinone) 1 alpha subcomplex subunit 5